ncbi:sensor histidine kinase [Neobacillus jeddahensis]|uniref:sensor histidine kinase n=1 Tax=Neobacillus jeddahensis TaxID=1461580 RepID=UPI00058EC51B|nr:HAMP domain-containing sensor histidine kinase [Neobacillus jeddahensis]
MFTRLRNKFLLLNMTITSMVMIAAFTIIYFITYNNIHSDIQNKLNAQSKMEIKTERKELPDETEKGGTMTTAQNASLDGPLSFMIEVDADGKIVNIDSFINLSEKTYLKAVETAWRHKKDDNTMTLSGKKWKYSIKRMENQIIQENGQVLAVESDNFQIIFLDVTEANKTLLELLTTLLLVGIIMLVVIFIISLYFANRAIKPIAKTWEMQKQFVADASHELKTPLSIINANYDVLMENQDETIKSQLKWLGYMRIGTDRMTKLVNDLLCLTKIEGVNAEIRILPFDFSKVVHDSMLSMEAVMLEKQLNLSYSIEPDIMVKSDVERMKQVVTILFENAIKYANENGEIDVTLLKSKRQVTFTIKNSGKGIAKQDLPKIFDRFYRGDPSRTQDTGGYGLGLSIAKTILDSLGGDIHATSIENKWTTFTVTLHHGA